MAAVVGFPRSFSVLHQLALQTFIFPLAVTALVLGGHIKEAAADNLLRNGDFDASKSRPTYPWSGTTGFKGKYLDPEFNRSAALKGSCVSRAGGSSASEASEDAVNGGRCLPGRFWHPILKKSSRVSNPQYSGQCMRLTYQKLDFDAEVFGFIRVGFYKNGESYRQAKNFNVGVTIPFEVRQPKIRDDRYLIDVDENGWETHSVVFRVPADKGRVKIQGRTSSYVKDFATYFDNISLEVVDCAAEESVVEIP